MITDENLKRIVSLASNCCPDGDAPSPEVIAALIIAHSNNGIEFSLDKMTKLISENLNNIASKII